MITEPRGDVKRSFFSVSVDWKVYILIIKTIIEYINQSN